MMKNIHVIFLLVLVAVSVSVEPAFAQVDDEKTDFVVYVEEALAHIKAAGDDLNQNNNALAVSHVSQPLTDLYASMKPELDEYNAATSVQLQQTLASLGDKVSKSNKQDAQNALDDASKVLTSALDAVVGDTLYDNIHFKVDVINDLLENSIDPYGVGVVNGTVVSPLDFETATSFVWQSKQLYADIKPQLTTDQISAIDTRYNDLDSAYGKKIGIGDVDPITDTVKAAFSTLGGQTASVDLSTYYANVKSLLNQAKSAYSSENTDTALNLVTQAYLDNFEFIEPTLAQSNLTLEQDLEKMIREDLRDMIKNGASSSDVSSEIDTIQSKLDSVASVVPEFGTLAGSILILAISAVIAIRIKNNKLMPNM
ncbi:MAG TPA: hypothetical protein VFX64_06790 [Candidatus Nitrosotalea sp.]|nr:hypothetical protein [Candidatus Nitrosotalea sp.]